MHQEVRSRECVYDGELVKITPSLKRQEILKSTLSPGGQRGMIMIQRFMIKSLAYQKSRCTAGQAAPIAWLKRCCRVDVFQTPTKLIQDKLKMVVSVRQHAADGQQDLQIPP
jgi:hypothetical protein